MEKEIIKLIINEEGKLKGFPPNLPATEIWWKDLMDNRPDVLYDSDYLVGNVLICNDDELEK